MSRFLRTVFWGALFVFVATIARAQEAGVDAERVLLPKRVGPYQQCKWDYLNGLEPFKNSATDPSFDKRFNPRITVSRRGLTARVVGVLSDETLARFGGSLEAVVEAYPYLTPVSYTAIHTVRPENITQPAAVRAANPAGEVVATEVIEFPPNAVMIIYPVSIAAEGFNTAAGNWTLTAKMRGVRNNQLGTFGLFPFLRYTSAGHALHGPITGDEQADEWFLRRGKVSHGCNRMDGEHITELAVLLGCPATGEASQCAYANEAVVVMEEFDHFPDPSLAHVTTGPVTDFSEIYANWVTPDIRGYPRDDSFPLPNEWRADVSEDALKLQKTIGKSWGNGGIKPQSNDGLAPTHGIVRVRLFDTWDNRLTSQGRSPGPIVVGRDCRP